MRWFIGICLVLAVACGADLAERRACYARAEAEVIRRAETECKGLEWENCPARDRIIDAGLEAEARCP